MTKIVEWQLPYSEWTAIDISANKVISLLLRSANNLLHVNWDNELYCDLQLVTWIAPTDDFPVWVTVWKVLASDGRPQNWLIINYKTTSWDYGRWIYWADGKIYFDWWTWTWNQVYFANEVDQLFTDLENSLATVAFSWDYNDLINRPSVIQLQADWNQTDTTSPDYIKNKPTALSDFTNDLTLADFPDDLRYDDYVVTSSEYEDLPDTKLTDGKIYMLYS
jgi:hypothetical protein